MGLGDAAIVHGDTEESGTADLSKAMQADRYPDGKPVWTFTDTVRVTVASPKGEIQNIKTIALANRKPVTSMELKRRQANDYVYEGTVAGTKVKGSFNAPKPFETDGALAPRLLQLANGKTKELKYLAYDEEARVEGPIEVTATREDGKTITLKGDDNRSWTTAIDAVIAHVTRLGQGRRLSSVFHALSAGVFVTT